VPILEFIKPIVKNIGRNFTRTELKEYMLKFEPLIIPQLIPKEEA